jgi:hypothetical protein
MTSERETMTKLTKTGGTALDRFIKQATDLGLVVTVEDSSSDGIEQFLVSIKRQHDDAPNMLATINNFETLNIIGTRGTSEYTAPHRWHISAWATHLFGDRKEMALKYVKYHIEGMAER